MQAVPRIVYERVVASVSASDNMLGQCAACVAGSGLPDDGSTVSVYRWQAHRALPSVYVYAGGEGAHRKRGERADSAAVQRQLAIPFYPLELEIEGVFGGARAARSFTAAVL
jgi:hypothetical protein